MYFFFFIKKQTAVLMKKLSFSEVLYLKTEPQGIFLINDIQSWTLVILLNFPLVLFNSWGSVVINSFIFLNVFQN